MRKQFLFLLILFLLSGCIRTKVQSVPTATPKPTFQPKPEDVILKLKKGDGTAIQITYREIQALPQVTETLSGKEESGVRLLDLLQHYGVTSFSSVSLIGNGQSIELAKDQVTNEVLLAYTKNSNLKLASPLVPKSQWVRTVLRIEIH